MVPEFLRDSKRGQNEKPLILRLVSHVMNSLVRERPTLTPEFYNIGVIDRFFAGQCDFSHKYSLRHLLLYKIISDSLADNHLNRLLLPWL